MNPRFVDTSFLLALSFRRDVNHQRAITLYRSLPKAYLTTEYVLLEFLDGAAGRTTREIAMKSVDAMRVDPAIRIIPTSADLEAAGQLMYRTHTDKEWGLTDCISFVVMRQHGLSEALTSDHHFEQAGFKALLCGQDDRHAQPPAGSVLHPDAGERAECACTAGSAGVKMMLG